MPTPATPLVRIEFKIRQDDAQLLQRMADQRGCSLAELVRRGIYQGLEPLARAQREREEIAAREVMDRAKLRAWAGDDPVRLHEAIVDDALQRRNQHN